MGNFITYNERFLKYHSILYSIDPFILVENNNNFVDPSVITCPLDKIQVPFKYFSMTISELAEKSHE